MIELDKALRKHYKMRRNVAGKNSVVVAMPYEVVEREARKKGLTVDEFLETYEVVAQYNSFDGVHYSFEEIKDGRERISQEIEKSD